jgi:hypothetical protein
VFELLMTLPWYQAMIEDVTVNRDWAIIRKGTETPVNFDLSTCYGDEGRTLVRRLTNAPQDAIDS